MLTIAQPAHHMLMGLRFFAFGDSIAPRNVAEAGGTSIPSAITAITATARLGKRFQALTGNGTTSDVTYGNASSYSLDGRSMTVLVRCKARIAAQVSGVVAARNGTTSGWQMLFSNFAPGGAEDGFNFAVFGASKFLEAQDLVGSSAQAGADVFVAGVYDHAAHEARLWTRQPGDLYASLRGTNTNTNSGDIPGTDWDVRVSQPIHLLNLTGSSNFFDGDLGWIAVFNRVLSSAEIQLWSMDEEWPFEIDDLAIGDYPIATTYLNQVSVDTLYAPGGSVTYTTPIAAQSFWDGDFTDDPSNDTPTYTNSVLVGQHYIGDIPDLVFYHNVVTVGSALTAGAPVTYTSLVRVGQRERHLVDGRVDLLGTTRYRR